MRSCSDSDLLVIFLHLWKQLLLTKDDFGNYFLKGVKLIFSLLVFFFFSLLFLGCLMSICRMEFLFPARCLVISSTRIHGKKKNVGEQLPSLCFSAHLCHALLVIWLKFYLLLHLHTSLKDVEWREWCFPWESIGENRSLLWKNKFWGNDGGTICVFHLPRGQAATFRTVFQWFH